MRRMRMLVGAAALLGGLAAAMPVAGAANTANLVKNPGAETGSGGNGAAVAVASWGKIGPATAVDYGAAGFPTAGTPGPANRGRQFFAGGPADTDFSSRTLLQSISLGNWAAKIAAGNVDFQAGAWLGGKGSIADNAMVQINFKNAAGVFVGNTITLGPVTKAQRGNVTKLLSRSATGSVPASARSVLVQVIFIDTNGGYVDGYADNITLKLLNV